MNGGHPEKEPEPFALFDCSLARLAIGRSCSNLHELLEAIQTVPDGVIEHHMRRCILEDHFELYEFPNDFARWCWDALGDRALAEQLSLIDPYRRWTNRGAKIKMSLGRKCGGWSEYSGTRQDLSCI